MASNTVYTVIVADDEEMLREAVCTMVPWTELGFQLLGSASNGLDALQMVEQFAPDLLLTDIRMPFISGIELARQVREIRPSMNIAFLSGYDNFEYAKQAIQYNIISYMLKPLTIEGISRELRLIHEKLDQRFEQFRQAADSRSGGFDVKTAFMMPLVLDAYGQSNEELERYALESGLLTDPKDHPNYTVMVTSLLSDTGDNCTTPAFVCSVDELARKYLRSVSFFSHGKVISVLLGNPSDFQEYLHILVEEISQMAGRILGKRCRIGVSRSVLSLGSLHHAYREAMEALQKIGHGEEDVVYVGDLPSAVSGGNLVCQKALELIQQHYGDPDLSLVSLSNLLEVSPNHLSACIKKYAGETFINILIRKRMEAAGALLSSTPLKIQEIAQRCGYTDQHYFSYCFKKYFGQSPNAMRRQLEAEKAGDAV